MKPTWSIDAANAVYPHARRIVDEGLTHGNEGLVVDEIEKAVTSLFPDLEGEPATTTAQEASFYVGVACCWLLMTEINGGAR